MKEQRQPAEIRNTGSEPACPPPDSQLAELIEVVWSCEVAAIQKTASRRPSSTGCTESAALA